MTTEIKYTFRVDLNMLRDEHELTTSLLDASDPLEAQINPPRPNERVLVRDDSDCVAEARVLALRGRVLDLAIEWDTWRELGPALEWKPSVRRSATRLPSELNKTAA